MGLLDKLNLKPAATAVQGHPPGQQDRAQSQGVAATAPTKDSGQSAWEAVRSSFEKAVSHCEELANRAHPKADVVRSLLDGIQTFADDGKFGKAVTALRELLPRLPPLAPGNGAPLHENDPPLGVGGGTAQKTPAPPVVTGVSPERSPAKGGAKVVVTGTGFTGAVDVAFDTFPASFVVDSDTQITATTPDVSRKWTSGSDLQVTVTTRVAASVHGAHIVTVTFGEPITVKDVGEPATVSGVSPDKTPAKGGTRVVITGTGFAKASAVSFSDLPARFVVDSDTQISATTPDSTRKWSSGSDLEVLVTNPAGLNRKVDHIPVVRFGESVAVKDVGEPATISGVSPDETPAKGGTRVVITGTGFAKATVVTFSDLPARFVVDSDTQISATTPDSTRKWTSGSDLEVLVTNPAGLNRKGDHIPSVRFGESPRS